MKSRRQLAAATDVLGASMRPIKWALSMTALAEEVLAELGDAPGRFLLLKPSEVLQGKAVVVMKHHMREIVTRHQRGEDTRPGTDAEVLCGLLGAATVHPINSSGMALAARLAARVIGIEMGIDVRERYEGEIDEQLAFSRRKLSQEWRR